ncbi:MAG: GNAT family N-acetyltransferase [Pseudomonadota bacterium]
MPEMPSIRLANGADFDPIGALIFDAIHTANKAYTDAERRAWMPVPPEGLAWAARLATQEVWVAEHADRLVGLITLAHEGYIDLAYILPDHRGTGLFQRLYDRLEAEARRQSVPRLWSHASLMARPALEKLGFQLIRPDPVERDGETLMRFEMEMTLIAETKPDA